MRYINNISKAKIKKNNWMLDTFKENQYELGLGFLLWIGHMYDQGSYKNYGICRKAKRMLYWFS